MIMISMHTYGHGYIIIEETLSPHLIIYFTARTHIHCIYVLVHGINKGIDSIRIDDNWTGCSYDQALTL